MGKLEEFFESMDDINPEALKVTGFDEAILGIIERIRTDPLISL